LILNKIPSLYALASTITKGSDPESALQLSMHIYSLFALTIAACILPVLRRPPSSRLSDTRPLTLILLSHLHAIDFLLGVTLTALFAITWFKMISNPDPSTAGPGTPGIDAGAGFTKPEIAVDTVEVGHDPQDDPLSPNVVISINATSTGNMTISIGDGSYLGPEGGSSLVLMCMLWAIRAYLLACVIIYTRNVARDASSRGLDATARQGWLDIPGHWLCNGERSFWLGYDHQSAKRHRVYSGFPRDSSDSNKESGQRP